MELQPAIAMFKDRGFPWERKYWPWRLVVAVCLWYFEHWSVAAPLLANVDCDIAVFAGLGPSFKAITSVGSI